MRSIRIIEDRSNLQEQIEAITIFDEMLTHINPPKISEDNGYTSIIKDIIQSTKDKDNRFHPYIHDTFKCFVDNKKFVNVNINFLMLNVKDKELLQLIVPLPKEVTRKEYESDISFWIDKENQENIINADTIELFENLKTIHIDTNWYYPFSLVSLLSIIKGTSIEKVIIIIGSGYQQLFDSLCSASEYKDIKEEYKKEQYEIREEVTELIISKF